MIDDFVKSRGEKSLAYEVHKGNVAACDNNDGCSCGSTLPIW